MKQTNISIINVDIEMLKFDENKCKKSNINRITNHGLVEIDSDFYITNNVEFYNQAKKNGVKIIPCILKGNQKTIELLEDLTLQIITDVRNKEEKTGKKLAIHDEVTRNLSISKGTAGRLIQRVYNKKNQGEEWKH